LRNPECFHCVVVDLATFWVVCGRDDPQETLMRIGEALGSLVAQMSEPEERYAARQDLAELILAVSEPVEGHA
jgi:hypothetical protein